MDTAPVKEAGAGGRSPETGQGDGGGGLILCFDETIGGLHGL